MFTCTDVLTPAPPDTPDGQHASAGYVRASTTQPLCASCVTFGHQTPSLVPCIAPHHALRHCCVRPQGDFEDGEHKDPYGVGHEGQLRRCAPSPFPSPPPPDPLTLLLARLDGIYLSVRIPAPVVAFA